MNGSFSFLQMEKWEMSKLLTRTLLWLFARHMYLVETGVPVQALMPQPTRVTVASGTAEHPWPCLSFAALWLQIY